MKEASSRFLPLLGLTVCLWVTSLWGMAQQAGPDSELTNAQIVQMTQLALGDEIIIAKIKASTCKFALSDSDLAGLKKAGISEKVIAAMVETNAPTGPRVAVGSKPLQLHALVAAEWKLGSGLIGGIRSLKQMAYLEGRHSRLVVSGDALILVELPPGDAIEDYLLTRLDEKEDRRELEVAGIRGKALERSGVRGGAIVKTSSTALGGNKFRISPKKPLKHGEYMIYVLGSAETAHGVYGRGYDFTVE